MKTVAHSDIAIADVGSSCLNRELEFLRKALTRKSLALSIARQERDAALAEHDAPGRSVHADTTPPLLLSVTDACRLLGIDPSHGYRLIKAGTFPATVRTIGHTLRVSRLEIEAFAATSDA